MQGHGHMENPSERRVKKSKKMFKCTECDFQTTAEELLKNHSDNFHPKLQTNDQDQFTCNVCDEKFDMEIKFFLHFKDKHTSKKDEAKAPAPVQEPNRTPLATIQAPMAPIMPPVQAPIAPVRAKRTYVPIAPAPAKPPVTHLQPPVKPPMTHIRGARAPYRGTYRGQRQRAPVQAPVHRPHAPTLPHLGSVQAQPAPVQAPMAPVLVTMIPTTTPVQAPVTPVQAPLGSVQVTMLPAQAAKTPTQAPMAPVQSTMRTFQLQAHKQARLVPIQSLMEPVQAPKQVTKDLAEEPIASETKVTEDRLVIKEEPLDKAFSVKESAQPVQIKAEPIDETTDDNEIELESDEVLVFNCEVS